VTFNKILRLGVAALTLITALGKLKQEDHEFDASLGYIVRPCLKNKNKKTKNPYIIF
jgi:hypothetical protein